MPLASVIMPSYNHEKHISEAIESVLNQSEKDLELIIVDDASKDSSPEIIKAYQEKDSRIRTIFHAQNKGIAKTVNDGIEHASGRFIAIVASDDIWICDKLEKQLKVLEENEDLVVCADNLVIDANSNAVENITAQKRGVSLKKRSGNIFKELLESNFVSGSSIILKRANLQGIGYDENYKYLSDWKFSLDLAKQYNYYFLPEPLVKYRIHGSNSIQQDGPGWLKDFALFGKDILEKYENDLPGRIKAKFLFRIGSYASCQKDFPKARKYFLKAVITYPYKIAYLQSLLLSFVGYPVVPKSLKRRIS